MTAAFLKLLLAGGSAAVLSPAWAVAASQQPSPALPIDHEAIQEALRADREASVHFTSSQAVLHYLLGSLAADRGDHADAIDQLRQTLALEENATHVRVRLGSEYWRLGMGERAEDTLRLAVADDPRSAEAHQALGSILLQADRLPEAAAQLREATALEPGRVEAYKALAEIERRLDDEPRLESCLDAWARNAPGDVTGWREQGQRFLAAGDLARAERSLNRALGFVPEDPQTLAALGQLADLRHDDAAALSFFERSARSDPDEGAVLFEVGRHHLRRAARLGDPGPDRAAARTCFNSMIVAADEEAPARAEVALAYAQSALMPEALQQLDGAVAADPGNPRWRYYRGMVALQLGRAKEAASDLALVPPSDEAFVDAQVRLGVALAQSGKPDQAVASLTAALEQRPTAAPLYVTLARIQRDRGHPAAAVALLEQVVERQGPQTDVVVALAEAYEAVGRRGDGLRLLRRTLEARPGDEAVLAEQALELGHEGRFEEAIAGMRKVLELDPRNADAMNFIGFALAERGQSLGEAEQLARSAIEVEPDNGFFSDSLGWIYFKEGKLGLAIETLRRACAQSPGVPAILEHLGDAYARNGDAREAAKSYTAALEALGHRPDPEQQAALQSKIQGLAARRASVDPRVE